MGWRTFTCTLMRINKSRAANRKPVLEEKSSGQQFHTTDQKQALSNKGKMNKDNKLFFSLSYQCYVAIVNPMYKYLQSGFVVGTH